MAAFILPFRRRMKRHLLFQSSFVVWIQVLLPEAPKLTRRRKILANLEQDTFIHFIQT